MIRTRHPCEKPVDLLRRCVRFATAPGQLVCDPFAGIGGTVVAAVAEGRRCLGIEIDARHAALADARARQASAELVTNLRPAGVPPHSPHTDRQ